MIWTWMIHETSYHWYLHSSVVQLVSTIIIYSHICFLISHQLSSLLVQEGTCIIHYSIWTLQDITPSLKGVFGKVLFALCHWAYYTPVLLYIGLLCNKGTRVSVLCIIEVWRVANYHTEGTPEGKLPGSLGSSFWIAKMTWFFWQ